MDAEKPGTRPGSSPGTLTTGQAAKLCGVTPDTVLKWIKSGDIEAVRTLGGHFRIDPRSIRDCLQRPCGSSTEPAGSQAASTRPLYCWEYLSDAGALREACNRCIVYQSHSAWCFRLKASDGGTAHGKVFCAQSCDDCAYYRRITGLPTHVLLATTDEQVTAWLDRQDERGVLFHLARNGYEASAVISSYHPSFAIVDQDSFRSETDVLLDCLSRDSRVPGLKVVLISCRGSVRPRSDVVRVVHKPFRIEDIIDVIESFPVERMTA